MKKLMVHLAFVATVFLYSGTTPAQDFDYHPVLTDNFIITLGAFRSDNSFKISAEGEVVDGIEDEILILALILT